MKNIDTLRNQSIPKRRQEDILKASFPILFLIHGIGVVANIILTQNRIATAVFVFVLLCLTVMYYDYHKRAKYTFTVKFINGILILNYLLYLEVAEHSVFVFYLFPPLAILTFYLNGLIKGFILSALALIGSIVHVVWRWETWQDTIFNVGSLINFLSGSVALLGVIILYELSIHSTHTALEKQSKQFLNLAHTDALTKLPNRLSLQDELLEQLNGNVKRSFSVLLIDVDQFKHINDTHGHKVGDEVLNSIANLLSTTFNKYGRVGRWGGDEFLVICPNISSKEAFIQAEKARKSIEKEVFQVHSAISISTGITENKSGDDEHTLLSRCDDALYQAKQRGKNITVVACCHILSMQ